MCSYINIINSSYALWVLIVVAYVCAVPLNYNFISTCVATCGILQVKCQSFLWKILFPRDEMWNFHEMRRGISTT